VYRTFILAISLLTGLEMYAQTAGCTDPKSPLYNPSATINDGSCTYGNTNYSPAKIGNLPAVVSETSGLLMYNGLLWTHNDSGNEPLIYGLDPANGSVLKTVRILSASMNDWEDMTADATHLYIGDFVNNNGNRTNLRIYKIPLEELSGDSATAETISFSYEDQTDFSSKPQNNNYDAEALITMGDSLIIFSKNWENLRTKLYVLPKETGSYNARLAGIFFVNGLVTGADFNQKDSVIMLCGYTKVLTPFLWLLWDFRDAEVFSGNKRRINLNLPLHQVEGVTWNSGSDYFITNETFTQLGNVPAALYTVNTEVWITVTSTATGFQFSMADLRIFPNPSKDSFHIQWNSNAFHPTDIHLFTVDGRLMIHQPVEINDESAFVDVMSLPAGQYNIVISGQEGQIHEVLSIIR
jgi:hypothetical protein